jgi:tRNA-intron endonuclease
VVLTGVLTGDKAVIQDERDARRIYNKGCYGTPLSGGGFALNLIEAVYLAETGKANFISVLSSLSICSPEHSF